MQRQSRHILRVFAVLLVSALSVGPGASAAVTTLEAGVLKTCLPRNAGVIAGRRLTGGSGFDFRVAKALAEKLGLQSEILWFENELEEESDPVRETYAMLAHGLCDIVPGHPRTVRAIGLPDYGEVTLPRWLGMPEEISRETGLMTARKTNIVKTQPIAVSNGYMRSEIGLVYRRGTPMPEDLNDTHGRVLALQQGTLSGAIVMIQSKPEVRALAKTFNPGAGFLWELESGGETLGIVDILAFDAHRKANPFTEFELADWRHPIGMDIGVAALTSNVVLMAEINRALDDLSREGAFQRFAKEEGMSYAPPKTDQLSGPLSMTTLLTER